MREPELSVAAAVDALTRACPPISGDESVPVSTALGRVLSVDVISALDLPAFDNAAMDGYALHADDLAPGRTLRLAGRSYAGHGFGGPVEPGTCVRITTGAPTPSGTAAVVMQEDTQPDAAGVAVTLRNAPAAGANIRRRGEHVAHGDRVLPRGRALRAEDLGLAASVGCATLTVRRRLRVGCLSTGDELADPPAPLAPSSAYDANRPFMLATAQRLGFDAVDLGICCDDARAFEQVIGRALAGGLDALLISGGAAQGDADIVRQAGGMRFVPVNFRPGRGIAWAQLQREGPGAPPLTVLGLPGNAVACFVMLHLIARPALRHLAGAPAAGPTHVPLPLARDVHLRGGRIDYHRARLVTDEQGRLALDPLRDQGSAMLRTVSEADALFAAGPDAHYPAGALVAAVLLEQLG